MRRAGIIWPLVALTIALVLVVAGCGGGGKRTLATAKAESMLKQLDTIASQYDAQACSGAHAKVLSLESQARALPRSVDSEVKRNLVTGLARLDSLVQRDCQKPQPQTNTNTTPTTPTTTTNTTPTTTTPTTTPTTPTTTPTSPSTTPTTPGGGGGVTVPGTTGAGGAQLGGEGGG
jgi:cytoskeletal protein RodZ